MSVCQQNKYATEKKISKAVFFFSFSLPCLELFAKNSMKHYSTPCKISKEVVLFLYKHCLFLYKTASFTVKMCYKDELLEIMKASGITYTSYDICRKNSRNKVEIPPPQTDRQSKHSLEHCTSILVTRRDI